MITSASGIEEVAAQLEVLAAVIKDVVLDLRVDAQVSNRAAAYARVYWLRREMGHMVATLGADVPAYLPEMEAHYREFIKGAS